MLSLLAIVVLIATLMTLFYQRISRGIGSVFFVVIWLLSAFLAPWLVHPVSLILLAAGIALLNHVDLRQKFISKPVYNALGKVMPAIGDTEREAIEAGTTWVAPDLFTGRPDWEKFAHIQFSTLTEEEQSFVDNEVQELCDMLDEWKIFHELRDLPEEVWDFLKHKGFFSLIIPKEYGGKAFSPYAQSRIMSKIATRSLTAAVTAMVPNSLGPGELLAEYGTQEQKDRWLPGLAKGDEIPCFGLTGPEAGSDAGAIPDTGVICKGEIDGKEVLGMRLNFAKRWITLAPVATIAVGVTMSMATVILANGTKGRRYALPNATIHMQQPLGGSRGQAVDMEIQARELLRQRALLNEMLVQSTGQSLERIARDTDRDYFMDAAGAKAYGVIDEVLEHNGGQ